MRINYSTNVSDICKKIYTRIKWFCEYQCCQKYVILIHFDNQEDIIFQMLYIFLKYQSIDFIDAVKFIHSMNKTI